MSIRTGTSVLLVPSSESELYAPAETNAEMQLSDAHTMCAKFQAVNLFSASVITYPRMNFVRTSLCSVIRMNVRLVVRRRPYRSAGDRTLNKHSRWSFPCKIIFLLPQCYISLSRTRWRKPLLLPLSLSLLMVMLEKFTIRRARRARIPTLLIDLSVVFLLLLPPPSRGRHVPFSWRNRSQYIVPVAIQSNTVRVAYYELVAKIIEYRWHARVRYACCRYRRESLLSVTWTRRRFLSRQCTPRHIPTPKRIFIDSLSKS